MSQNTTPSSLFGAHSGAEKPMSELLPAGHLSFGVVSLSDKGMGTSQKTGGEYANLIITLFGTREGNKRKIYYLLPNPLDQLNSEAWRAMGLSAITRMLEAIGFFVPGDKESYNKLNYEGVTFEDMLEQILGQDIAVEIGVEKGTEGRADKNSIKNFLTPSTDKASARGKGMWDLLCAGITTSVKPKAAGAPASPGGANAPAKKLGPAALAAQSLKAGTATAAPATSAGGLTGLCAGTLKSPASAAAGLSRPSMFGPKKEEAPVVPPTSEEAADSGAVPESVDEPVAEKKPRGKKADA